MSNGPTPGVTVHAGFPNPATDRGYNNALSLDQLLIRHPSSTFYFTVSGHTWADQGIFDGDIAVIDRSLSRRPQDLVACWQNEQFALVRTSRLSPDDDPWGTVAAVIHRYRP